MQQILEVKIDEKHKYNIEISDEKIEHLSKKLDDLSENRKRLIVISKKVYNLYASSFKFKENELFILKDGEKEKNINNYLKIVKKAISLGLTRKDLFIAIGGGVVGDITGFVASTYMRGVEFIQVPTTLLSAVDSSVGGKTAIDIEEAKNVIGTFNQPSIVLININFLNTLDNKQFMSGMGEVLKYAFIENNCSLEKPLYLYEFLTLSNEKILKKEILTIVRMIEYCLKLKIAVVTQDEKENGLRKILNLGHTYGHALETITNYKKFTHGEAVVQGLFMMLNYAYQHEHIENSYYKLSLELLQKYGYKQYKRKYPVDKILNIMKKDKKAENNKINFIVPSSKKTVKEIFLIPQEVKTMLENSFS